MRNTARRLLPAVSVLVVVPLLLTACSSDSSTGTPGGSSATPRTPGDSWIVVDQGVPTPSPTPRGFGSPSATPTGGFLPLGTGPARPTPAPTCTDIDWRIGEINGLAVVPGPGTAKVSWVHAGGIDLVEYRVTAISQDLVTGTQRDIGWKAVAPTAPCQPMSVTLTGLDRRTTYTFSLDAVFTRKSGDGTRASTVARALVVDTT